MDETQVQGPNGHQETRVLRVKLQSGKTVALPADVATAFIERIYATNKTAAASAMHYALTGEALR